LHRYFLILLLTLATPVWGQTPPAPKTGERPYSFYSHSPYRRTVPRPATILGYEAGEKLTTYRDQERVVMGISQSAKDRVLLIEYGKSVEGRPLRLLAITAPENLAQIENLRLQNLKLADPRTLSNEAERAKSLKNAPAIVWINHCIHGNETASFEAFMWTLYTLAASESDTIKQTLKNAIILLNPVFNPDGHERFAVYYNSVALGNPEYWALEHEESWAIWGRFNHYRFDMNRDKLPQSQAETRQEIAAYTRWFPHVYVDQHGQPETYFFPPNPEAIHQHADVARLNRWANIFGKANAAAFDSYGWQYVIKEDYDFFYPGYLDTWATFSGAIGMTYETDGGKTLARRRRDDTVSTLRDGIAHHVETALATITTAAKNRSALVQDFFTYRQKSIQAGKTAKEKAVVLPPGDPLRTQELTAILLRSGIEVYEATEAFEANKAYSYLPLSKQGSKRTFPKGSLIISYAQPQGLLARSFLEPDAAFNPDFVKLQNQKRQRNEKRNENERGEGYEFYDITAWSLPYAFHLDAYWLEENPTPKSRLLALKENAFSTLTLPAGGIQGAKSQIGYLIPYTSENTAILGLKLAQEGYRLAVLTKPVKVEGKEWERGTLYVRVNRNPAELHERLDELAKQNSVAVTPLHTAYNENSAVSLGSDSVQVIREPRIAVVAGEQVSQTSCGAIWYLLEQVAGLKFSMLTLKNLSRVELNRFNVILLPDGYGYASTLGKAGIDRLKEWVRRGGALIGFEGGGVWFTDKESGISSATVVGEGVGKRPTELAGALFKAKIDLEHSLGYGYAQEEIPVPMMGSTFLKPTTKGSNVVTFGKAPLRLSGFVWQGNTEEILAGTSYVLDEPLGRGHAVLFLNDPAFRALWAGLRRMVWNSILFMPAISPDNSP
jgi:hypothetical protein